MVSPSLYKPKSKIRLRLGLTPPHPAPKQKSAAHLSPLAGPDLASSTSTSVSGISRTDSRSAFTYDSATPSPESRRPEFDTISYNTISPESLAYTAERSAEDNPSALTLITEFASTSNFHDESAYPTPDPTSPSADDHDHPYDRAAEAALHPALNSIAAGTDDIFSITDEQLSERFTFVSEIGFGNWGSVWRCKPKHIKHGAITAGDKHFMKLGKRAAACGGGGAGGKVAVKLVHRSRDATTAARVRALWGEMKIIRSLRHEPHPSIIQFESFVITPSYAMVIMPHLSRLIPVRLDPQRATPYFRQLASAVGYLHERGITHNDIKPANVLLSYNDIPVLVDFGFAQQWDIGSRGCFLSSISWGTPEYLDPLRAHGMPHDERASDVWSLGITMFEILIGRTPFEDNEEEEFASAEDLLIYYERARRGHWIGYWEMPADIENLLRHMINPDPAYRISAMQAYHHPALIPAAPSVIITPHFVRAAASFDEYQEPIPQQRAHHAQSAAGAVGKSPTLPEKRKKRKAKKDVNAKDITRHSHRSVTPALGESIKQHTSVGKPSRHTDDKEDKENRDSYRALAASKLVIKSRQQDDRYDKCEEEDPTPTKMVKAAQPLRIKELSLVADKKVVPRTSNSQLTNLSRPNSAASGNTATGAVLSHSSSMATLKDKRVSVLSSSSAPKSKEETVLRTMRSLEGTRKLIHAHNEKKEKATEALAAVKRAAPEPPRPRSLDSVVERSKKEEERRSLGLDRAVLVEINEEEVDITAEQAKKVVNPTSPPCAQRSSVNRMPTPSPQKVRRARKAHAELDALRNKVLPAYDDESPLPELQQEITAFDADSASRYRRASKEMETLIPIASASSARDPAVATADVDKRGSVSSVEPVPFAQGPAAIPRTQSVEALALDSRLDKMSTWIKSVEHIIEDARKAIAEGREPPLPVLTLPREITGDAQEHRFGVTPDKVSAIPMHLRTSSTQVEPSTPPKWMTMAEAEEKVKAANKWMEEQGRKGKKERPTVSHVLKLFGTEREKATGGPRSNTPEPGFVPLKPPASASQRTHALRGAPSTPALRSSTTRGLTRVPQRKSESNLRNFNTMPVIPSPSFVAGPEYDALSDNEDELPEHVLNSPRRVRYENLLTGEPGVVRQGDGWGSMSSGKGMMKPSSSMASLRERARALLGDSKPHERNIVDLSKPNNHHKLEKRSSRLTLADRSEHPARPGTPAAQSVLTMKTDGGKKGWLKSLKGAMGMGKKGAHGLEKEEV
ncbi:CAMK/CAMKL protein kinase [Kwoniella heveanensis CBS 569]|nr:CAMK/CAMKL protein kinase [Kwoniella heveanensis CBS 569]